jgi:Fic family protein
MPAPLFQLIPQAIDLALSISGLLGRLQGLTALVPQPRLRRANRIRTVQGTVAIEGNPFAEAQVTAVLDGKRVQGSAKHIREVENANAAYEQAADWSPTSPSDLLKAHRRVMKGLLPDAGRWRSASVGVMRGRRATHIAPPAARVPRLVAELLRWARVSPVPPLIKACVVHYELQFIHPFSDGNGRVGRLWQHVSLLRVSPAFASLPVESVIHDRQAKYYRALAASDRAGDSTPFLLFSLTALRDALNELLTQVRPQRETTEDRLAAARAAFASKSFTRRDYLGLHQLLSTATGSRDLKSGVDSDVLRSRGERRTTTYVFRR